MKLRYSAFHRTFDGRFLKFATNFNFILQLSIKSRNLNQSCKFHAELRWEVASFVEKEKQSQILLGRTLLEAGYEGKGQHK